MKSRSMSLIFILGYHGYTFLYGSRLFTGQDIRGIAYNLHIPALDKILKMLRGKKGIFSEGGGNSNCGGVVMIY